MDEELIRQHTRAGQLPWRREREVHVAPRHLLQPQLRSDPMVGRRQHPGFPVGELEGFTAVDDQQQDVARPVTPREDR
jgi:hypothetical protein